MEINRKNYEIFFLDYLDGNLSGNQIDQFLDFLEQNEDLKTELSEIEKINLPANEIRFKEKNTLYKTKKDQAPANQNTAVAYLEGDLSELENKLFLKHLEFHPEQSKDLDLLMKTRLQADETIEFKDKQKLYKKSTAKRFIYWGSRVAALLVIAFAIAVVFDFGTDSDELNRTNQLVQNNAESISKIINELKVIEAEETNKIIPTETRTIQAPFTSVLNSEIPKLRNSEIPAERIPEIIEPLAPILAKAEITPVQDKQIFASNSASFIIRQQATKYYTLDQYFIQEVLKIKKKEPAERKSIFESGLELASNASGKRINYETENGRVSTVSLDTKLFAFSIPVRK